MLHAVQYEHNIQAFNATYADILPFFPKASVHLIREFLEPKMRIFNELVPSTLTAQGMLSNAIFNEADIIHAVNPTKDIPKIVCNYGEVFHESYADPVPVKKATNRGRKKKKKPNTRKNQGSGKYFNSQVTFWYKSKTKEGKYYKVKGFRPGTVEVPGGLDPSMKDVIEAVEAVAELIGDTLAEDVKVLELYSIMRNYKFDTIDPRIRINIRLLYELLVKAKKNGDITDIVEIKYNVERYPGLILKFSTPIPRNQQKQTTLKLFQSGKGNIDGAISEESAMYHYNRVNAIYAKYSDILYIPKEDNSSDDSSSDDEPVAPKEPVPKTD
jgi:hypothetical protein